MTRIFEYLKRNPKYFSKRNVLISILIIGIGIITNLLFPQNRFFIYQSILLIMFILQYIAVSKMIQIFVSWDEKYKLGFEVEGAVKNSIDKMKNNYIILVSAIFIVLFMSSIIFNKYIEINLSGMYGIFLGSITFFGGIIAYYYYIVFLVFINDLSQISLSVKEIIPAYNPSLINLGKNLISTEKYFFVLGILYTILYAILSFSDLIKLSENVEFFDKSNWLFLISWFTILLFFVFAYPILVFSSKKFLKEVVRKIKQEKINDFFLLIEHRSKNDPKDIERVNQLLDMINKIDQSKDTPLYRTQSLLNRIAAFISSLFSLITPFLTIYLNSLINP